VSHERRMDTALRENPVHPAARPPDPPGDEIDLLAYASVWWRYRYVLLGIALVTGTVTYIVNRQMTPTYETHFRLMGTEPGLSEERAERLNMVAFRELVESPTEVAALLSEFKLTGPPHSLTPRRFIAGYVDIVVVRDSTIIDVAVRLKQDRELLVRLARRYAERVVETAQRLNTEGINYTAAQIKQQRDAALDRLKEAERTYEEHQQRAQVELLQQDVDTLLERRPEALDLNVRIQGARARLKQAEAELGQHQPTRAARRGVDSVAGGATVPPGSPATPEDLKIRSELLDPYVNPVYEALQRDISTYRAQLAGLEQERKELVSRLNLDSPTAEKLNRLYAAEAALETLSRDREITRDAYLNAANKYEEVRLQSTLRSPRLQILDQPIMPDAPIAPRAVRNTLAAVLFALTFGAVAAIVFDSRRSSARIA
jgi:capsular polysaccharide biosynthesis protein